MVSFTKIIGFSLAAFSAVNAASVPSVTSELVARDDPNSQVCGCSNQMLLDIIYKVENFGQQAAKNIAAQIDAQHPDNDQIANTIDELTELINSALNLGHGTICVDAGIIGVVLSAINVQIQLIKSILANIGLFPITIILSLHHFIQAVFSFVSAIVGAIHTKNDLHCFMCADVQTLNSIGYIITSIVQLVIPNAPNLPALAC